MIYATALTVRIMLDKLKRPIRKLRTICSILGLTLKSRLKQCLAISAFAALVSMGGAPKVSIFMGKGDNEQAEKVMGSCTWMLIALSMVLTGIMLGFGKTILQLFGASDDTISYAVDYMNY